MHVNNSMNSLFENNFNLDEFILNIGFNKNCVKKKQDWQSDRWTNSLNEGVNL